MGEAILRSLSDKDLYTIGKSIIESNKLGFVLYREKIIYANDYICRLFGYERDELEGMSIVNFAHESLRDKFSEIIKNRLSGKESQKYYSNVMCVRKDGRFLFVNFVADTVTFEGKTTGFLIVTDNTAERELSVFYSVLKNINHLIIKVLDLSKLFESVCKIVVSKYAAKIVWIGRLKESGELEPVFIHGEERSYVDELFESGLIEKEPSFLAVKKGSIEIVVNVDDCDFLDESIREKLKQHGIRSACYIPLRKKGKYRYIFSVYVRDYNFVEDYMDVMKELQNDLSFALDRIEEVQEGITFYEAAKSSNWWFLITDENGKIIFVNRAVEQMSGYTKNELIGKTPRVFKSGLHDKKFYEDLWRRLLNGEVVETVIANRRKDGTIFHLQNKIMMVRLPGGIKRFVAIGKDITKEIELTRETQRMKVEDALTGLLNLNGFIYTVESRIKTVETGVMVLVDIVNFSYINRIYSFEVGDKLLKLIADRLREEFPLVNCIARIGSDDFALFVDKNNIRNSISAIPAKLLEVFGKPFDVNGENIRVSFNAGIVVYPMDALTVKELMEKASVILNKAKEKGENVSLFYNPIADESVERYIHAENLIDKAFRESLFFLEYQPYFSAWEGKIFGAEALVRIKDNDGKVHYPNEFIDYLEGSKYLRDFEMWLLNQVKSSIERWNKHITINISATSFKDEKFIDEILKACSVVGGNLGIEITERTLMSDLKESRKVIQKLKSFSNPPLLSIDDFGTGYASLSMLQEFPIDIIKIDMSFVRGIHNNRKNIAIVQTIIQLAKTLGIKTIAEGVEEEEEYKTLRTMGADFIQGYYFAKPMDEVAFESMIKREEDSRK